MLTSESHNQHVMNIRNFKGGSPPSLCTGLMLLSIAKLVSINAALQKWKCVAISYTEGMYMLALPVTSQGVNYKN